MVAVGGNSDLLPPLGSKEQNLLKQYLQNDYIDRATLIIPPIICSDSMAEKHKLMERELSALNHPILQSEIVQKRLEHFFNYPEQTRIQLHRFSLTLYDYINHTIDVYYFPECEAVLKSDLIINGIRRMFTSFFPDFSAAMIHSSALLINGKVGIFLAPDEGGKTTASKLGAKYSTLCDDQNIIKKENNEFIAYSTPWGKDINNSVKGPVKGFFLLKKGDLFKLETLKPKDLFSYLWNEHLSYSMSLPETYRLKFFNLLYTLSHNIPGHQLTFPKTYIDWNAVENVMQ